MGAIDAATANGTTGSRRTLLDGGWWPRSIDPVAELPGLVLAIDKLRGPVTRMVLSADGWDRHPRRLGVARRVLRLGYFTSRPTSLLTALCANGDRVDLLVVPPDTATRIADAAMVLAATTTNLFPAQHILLATGTQPCQQPARDVWETDGDGLAAMIPATPRTGPRSGARGSEQ
ncbi:DUF5994 family protein [Micromonospora sp. NPDC049679]|uniref:DUF5994 family protein n=1 Tax=Micromonospora sp. NPDC049679 TaxID=3155920 RepID=UPI003405A878